MRNEKERKRKKETPRRRKSPPTEAQAPGLENPPPLSRQKEVARDGKKDGGAAGGRQRMESLDTMIQIRSVTAVCLPRQHKKSQHRRRREEDLTFFLSLFPFLSVYLSRSIVVFHYSSHASAPLLPPAAPRRFSSLLNFLHSLLRVSFMPFPFCINTSSSSTTSLCLQRKREAVARFALFSLTISLSLSLDPVTDRRDFKFLLSFRCASAERKTPFLMLFDSTRR